MGRRLEPPCQLLPLLHTQPVEAGTPHTCLSVRLRKSARQESTICPSNQVCSWAQDNTAQGGHTLCEHTDLCRTLPTFACVPLLLVYQFDCLMLAFPYHHSQLTCAAHQPPPGPVCPTQAPTELPAC
jgi:hypothetical protein